MAAKKKKLSKAQRNVAVDTALFGLFSLALAQEATGLALHEWVGLAALGTAAVHYVLHSKWLVSNGKRFFGKLPLKTRASYVLNGLLLANAALLAYSGLSISEVAAPGLISNASPGIWSEIHESASGAFIGLVAAHLALHWKWILGMFKKYLLKPFSGLASPRSTTVQTTQKGA